MVPLAEYGKVNEGSNIDGGRDGAGIGQERRVSAQRPYLHRAVLVYDKKGKICGKIGQIDILRALEPKYKSMGDTRAISRAGFSAQFLRSMMENYSLCDTSLSEMCSKAGKIRVKDFMYSLEEGEVVEADASLCEAIHQFVLGEHLGLLVVREGKIVGVLRSSDVFMKIFEILRHCQI